VRLRLDFGRLLEIGPKHEEGRSLFPTLIAARPGEGIDEHKVLVRVPPAAQDRDPGIEVLAQDDVLCLRMTVDRPERLTS